MCSRREFAWGSCYTHAFYLLEPKPPFGLAATSPEFCLASASDSDDCESIQFVSSLSLLAREPDPALLLAFGDGKQQVRDAARVDGRLADP